MPEDTAEGEGRARAPSGCLGHLGHGGIPTQPSGGATVPKAMQPPLALPRAWGCMAGLIGPDRGSWDTSKQVCTLLGTIPSGVRCIFWRRVENSSCCAGHSLSPSTSAVVSQDLACPAVFINTVAQGPWHTAWQGRVGRLGNRLCRKPEHLGKSPAACTGGETRLAVRHGVVNMTAMGTGWLSAMSAPWGSLHLV